MNTQRDVVIVNCFDTYEHRVELLVRYFESRKQSVLVLTSDWLHFHKSVRTQCPQNYEMIHVYPYTKNLSVGRLRSHHYFAKDVLTRLDKLKPKLLWVMVPPNSLVERAAEYKKAHSECKLVLDFIDMWPETMPISKFKSMPPFTNWRDLRDTNLVAADAIVTECDLYHTILEKHYAPDNIHTLYLARKAGEYCSRPQLPEDRVALCYLGSINNIIDIPLIVQIIKGIQQSVDFHIIGDGENCQMLIDAAQQAGANVVFHGKVYDSREKQQIFDRCHFGLNIMKKSVFVGLTMKSIDYFEGGLPIINNIKGDTWQFVEQKGIGINVETGKNINWETIDTIQRNRKFVRTFFQENFTEETFHNRVHEILARMNTES